MSNTTNLNNEGGSGGVNSWVDVTAATQLMVPNTGYTADNNSTPVVFTLPAVAKYGTSLRVVGKGTAGWQINQGAGQVIHSGNQNSTVGVTGGIASTLRYDTVSFLCTVANLEFTSIDPPQGSPSIF
jgi:hypothetical protein